MIGYEVRLRNLNITRHFVAQKWYKNINFIRIPKKGDTEHNIIVNILFLNFISDKNILNRNEKIEFRVFI